MRRFKRPLWDAAFIITDVSEYSCENVILNALRRTVLHKAGKYYAVYCMYTEEGINNAIRSETPLEIVLLSPASKVKYFKKVV